MKLWGAIVLFSVMGLSNARAQINQDVHPTAPGTTRSWNIQTARIAADLTGSDVATATRKCSAELVNTRNLLIQKGVQQIMEIVPCHNWEEVAIVGEIYFIY